MLRETCERQKALRCTFHVSASSCILRGTCYALACMCMGGGKSEQGKAINVV